MLKVWKEKLVLTAVCASVLLFVLFAGPSPLFGESITIAPYKINLKAQGQFEDVQVVIRMPLASGYSLADYEVNLRLEGEIIAQAFDFRYCYIDDNFLASFDRYEVMEHPSIIALANTTVIMTIDGWYTAVNSDGQEIRHEFSGEDVVEIMNPGK